MGLIRKLRNRLFQNLEFCIHDATLGADLASCGCRMDMVDGALERVDVACFNPNIEIVSWCLFLLENSFEFRDFSKFTGLRFSKKKHCAPHSAMIGDHDWIQHPNQCCYPDRYPRCGLQIHLCGRPQNHTFYVHKTNTHLAFQFKVTSLAYIRHFWTWHNYR